MMQITIYNFKGGVGKTSIALNIALTCNFGIITNDVYSPLEKVLSEKKFIKIFQEEALPDIPEDIDVIFDLGGHVDQRAIKAITETDQIVVPTTGDYINLQVTIDAITEIEKYTKKIVIIANRTSKNSFNKIKKILNHFCDYPVIELKESKAFSNIFSEKKSIQAMVNEGGLKAYNYRLINDQFNNLLKHIGITKD
jgi:cellulose biosynthesis protein BcsQ